MYSVKVTNKINVCGINDTYEFDTVEPIHKIWKWLFGHIRQCINGHIGCRIIVRDWNTGTCILWAYVRIMEDDSICARLNRCGKYHNYEFI